MPAALPPTVAEREAELIALQNAFDEYIASSRELEEELDAELAKMQEKLAESTAANAALSAQLENIAPQLASLEGALSESRRKLKQEQTWRRTAEQAQDEADQRVREMEQSLQQVREECDVVHEELAFRENELEETRLELEVEKQELENELARLRTALEERPPAPETNGTSNNTSQNVQQKEEDEAYVRKLEEELELVTEQLIEMEKRLSQTESELKEQTEAMANMQGTRGEEDEELIRQLQQDSADHLETEQKLRQEITELKDELTLSKEEVALQQEELQAAEEDYKNTLLALEEEKARHKEEVTQLQIEAKEALAKTESNLGEAAAVAASMKDVTEENDRLREEVAAVESALANAKKDYEQVMEELEAVNARFDEAIEEAKVQGHSAMADELRAAMKSDAEHEVNVVKEELSKLSEENKTLQEKINATEMALAAAKDMQNGKTESEEDSEVVKHLQAQLAATKEELQKKQQEMNVLSKTMEERLGKAEESISTLENQLHETKEKLAEAESLVIGLKAEKDRREHVIPLSPKRSPKHATKPKGKVPETPVLRRGRSADRAELAMMEIEPTPMRERSRSTSPSSVMRLEYRLSEETQKFAKLEKEYKSLQDQKRMCDVRIKRMEEDLRILQRQLFAQGDGAVVTQMTRLSSLASNEKGMDVMTESDADADRVKKIIQSRDVKAMTDELVSLEKKCNSQREYNAQLLSKMLHLQGNIQVYCRVRPVTFNELEKGYKSVVESLSETEVGCFDARTNKWKSFAFDRVWGPDHSQQSVFQDVEPLALSVVDGFNACIFAYGQTGSGKTYTMEGIPDNSQFGISYRTIQKIFHLLNLRAQQQRAAEIFVGESKENGPAKEVAFEFEIHVGMLEIYNDEIYDLLNTEGASMAEKKQGAMKAGGKASLEIRRDKNGRVEVPNLTKEKVGTIEEVMDLLKKGNANRATAATDMNEHSSRSHMVLMVDVTSGVGESQSNKGTLYLVDLAGSERVRKSHVEGEHLKEAGFINKSLSALGNVMEALDRKASHVPYRDSKLTYMLQDSLGGNSRTMMVVAICPTDHSYDESVHALQFATRVRRIQIGAAERNVTSKNLEETVKSLTAEMRALTRAKERTESQLHSLKRDNNRVQEKLQNLNKSRSQGRTDSKTLDVLRKNNDDMAARWQKEKTAREEATEDLEKCRRELRTVQQQLGKTKSQMNTLERKLDEKEKELSLAGSQLRQVRSENSAATVRARREQVFSARKRPATAASPAEKEATTEDVDKIRSEVLELLKKHDAIKVDRLDIIMEKFKGRETLLLEKMKQRYEGSEQGKLSFIERNKLSVQRHQERMKKMRDSKASNGS